MQDRTGVCVCVCVRVGGGGGGETYDMLCTCMAGHLFQCQAISSSDELLCMECRQSHDAVMC